MGNRGNCYFLTEVNQLIYLYTKIIIKNHRKKTEKRKKQTLLKGSLRRRRFMWFPPLPQQQNILEHWKYCGWDTVFVISIFCIKLDFQQYCCNYYSVREWECQGNVSGKHYLLSLCEFTLSWWWENAQTYNLSLCFIWRFLFCKNFTIRN